MGIAPPAPPTTERASPAKPLTRSRRRRGRRKVGGDGVEQRRDGQLRLLLALSLPLPLAKVLRRGALPGGRRPPSPVDVRRTRSTKSGLETTPAPDAPCVTAEAATG